LLAAEQLLQHEVTLGMRAPPPHTTISLMNSLERLETLKISSTGSTMRQNKSSQTSSNCDRVIAAVK
jgi:hypothetical protein